MRARGISAEWYTGFGFGRCSRVEVVEHSNQAALSLVENADDGGCPQRGERTWRPAERKTKVGALGVESGKGFCMLDTRFEV